jgi:hypothetical protein
MNRSKEKFCHIFLLFFSYLLSYKWSGRDLDLPQFFDKLNDEIITITG